MKTKRKISRKVLSVFIIFLMIYVPLLSRAEGSDPISYTYDALGNIKSKTIGNTTYNYEDYDVHAVKKIVVNNGTPYYYTYDNNGNMKTGPDFSDPAQVATRTITYNEDNMPVEVKHQKGGQTTTVSFIYDGDGERAIKDVEGTKTRYISDIYEKKGATFTKYIFAGNMRIAKVDTSGTYYYHKDHLQSTTVLTDLSGEVDERTEYMPFGSTREHDGDVSDYKFTDQELDPETGLYNYGARLYDPFIGRFISPDTIVQAPLDPQTLNRYSYCRNNPLIYTDPSGNIFFIDDIIIHAIWGAIFNSALAAVTGGDIGEAALTGAVSGGFFGAAGGIIKEVDIVSSLGKAGVHTVAGAASGGINAEITGGDVGMGMVTGAMSGGISKYVGSEFLNKADFGVELAGHTAIGGVIGGVSAEMYGGEFSEGFKSGAQTAVAGLLFNKYGGKIGKAVVTNTMQLVGLNTPPWINLSVINPAWGVNKFLGPIGGIFFSPSSLVGEGDKYYEERMMEYAEGRNPLDGRIPDGDLYGSWTQGKREDHTTKRGY